MTSQWHLAVGSVACLGVLACGEKEGSTPPPPTPAITLSLSTTATSIQAGGEGSLVVTLGRTNFAAAVTLEISGLPAGMAGTFAPASVPGTATSSVLTLTATRLVIPGTYTATVAASGSGVAPQSSQLSLTITAPPALVLSLAPSALSVTQGSTGRVVLTIQGLVSASVRLEQRGVPPGVVVTFEPPAQGGFPYSIYVGDNVAPGVYPITFTGVSDGASPGSTTLQLTVVAAPVMSIALSASPQTLTLQQSGQATATLNIVRANFAGPVTLAASGLPTGAVAVISEPVTTGTAVSVSLLAGSNTLVGTSTITFTATGQGVPSATASIALTVTAIPAIRISATPATLTLLPGNAGTLSVAIVRTNYADPVTLTATGLPTGTTASFSPTPVPGTTSTLTISAGNLAPAGSFHVTLTATGIGVASVSTSLILTITPPPTVTVTWQYCGSSIAPVWFAVQDGAGPWTRILPSSGTTYDFQLGSVGGVAVVTAGAGSAGDIRISYGTRAELQALGAAQCAPQRIKQVTGTVLGLGAGERALVALGSAQVFVNSSNPNFVLGSVPDGIRDLVAERSQTATGTPLRFAIQRNLNPPTGINLGSLDLAGGSSFAPVQQTLTLHGAISGEQTSVGTTYHTPNGSAARLATSPLGTASSLPFYGFPSTQLNTGELHELEGGAQSSSGGAIQSRGVSLLFVSMVDQTLTLGPTLALPSIVTLPGSPHVRVRAAIARQAEYASYWRTLYRNFAASPQSLQIEATGSYVGSADPVVLEVPDFSGVAGWNNAWMLTAGVSSNWSTVVQGWSGSTVGGFFRPLIAGTLTRSAVRHGTFVP